MLPEISINNNVWSAIILVAGSIITTILTVKYKDRIQRKLISKKPKDRLELIFDGYERLITELHSDIATARDVNNEQNKRLTSMQVKMDKLEDQLSLANRQNRLAIARIRKYEPDFSFD